MKQFKVGSDPEFLLSDSSGKIISSIGLLGGTKNEPRQVQHGSIQEDNILAEFNSIPASNLQDFIRNHNLIMGELRDILKPLSLDLDSRSSIIADKEILSDLRAMVSGCDPDFDAWRLAINRPVNYSFTDMRAAGGHLHISFEDANSNQLNRVKLVKALDMELGVPSVILDPDKGRRMIYGKAGAHRPKFQERDGYDGVEYRVLSNFWLMSEELMSFIFNKVEKCVNNLEELSNKADSLKDMIVSSINSSDKDLALKICEEYNVQYSW